MWWAGYFLVCLNVPFNLRLFLYFPALCIGNVRHFIVIFIFFMHWVICLVQIWSLLCCILQRPSCFRAFMLVRLILWFGLCKTFWFFKWNICCTLSTLCSRIRMCTIIQMDRRRLCSLWYRFIFSILCTFGGITVASPTIFIVMQSGTGYDVWFSLLSQISR